MPALKHAGGGGTQMQGVKAVPALSPSLGGSRVAEEAAVDGLGCARSRKDAMATQSRSKKKEISGASSHPLLNGKIYARGPLSGLPGS